LSHDTSILKEYIIETGGYANFEIGNLEFVSPTLEDALEKILKHGAEKVIFVGGTGFMDRSSHSLVDIPEAIEKLQKTHHYIRMSYIEPNIDLVCTELAQIITAKVEDAIK
jgi:sirohydrochlorin ferrochelatase